MKMNEEVLNRMRKFQKEHLASFELEFLEPIELEYMERQLTMGDNYWMINTDKQKGFWRFRGVDLKDYSTMFIGVAKDYCYITVPLDSDVKCIIRFADRYCCKIYMDGELIYSPSNSLLSKL